MRMIAAIVLTTAMAVSEANASSIVVLDDAQGVIGPSIIILDETYNGSIVETQEVQSGSTMTLASVVLESPSITVLSEPAGTATPSIVVLGGPGMEATQDKIGEVPPAETRDAGAMSLMPMVIRGGIVGDAFQRPIPSSASQDNAEAPPPLDPNDRGTPSKRRALKRQAEEQRALDSASQAVPAPMPQTE